MTLLYDAFGIRRVAIELNFWPAIDKFETGDLSRLFGILNRDEIFSTCELRSEEGALFVGEAWTYDLSTSALLIRCTSIRTHPDLRAQISELLKLTREALSPRLAFYTDEIRVFGQVPEGGKRDVDKVVRKKLISRNADLDDLPGLDGAGITLNGFVEAFAWRAEIEPLGEDALQLTGRINFRPGPEPPHPGSDLEVIEQQTQAACEFVSQNLKTFSSKLFP